MISIVIPLYNKQATIVKTVQSVLSQTFQHFEMVIVDDGSTDGSVDVLRQAVNDERINIIQQANQGVSAARNKGVACARYDYIAFLDGDDEWMPAYLLTMHNAIEKFPHAGMFCCAGIVRNGNIDHPRLAKKYKGQVLEINFFENPHVFLHTSATIVKKQVFNQTGGFPVNMKRNQDFALFFSVALITPVVYCGLPLSIYNGNVEGQATSTPAQKVISHIVSRYNFVYRNFEKTKAKNNTFIIFLKYELRHDLLGKLRSNDYTSIKYYIENLKPSIFKVFPTPEIYSYKHKALKQLAIGYILFTKVIWRLRGHPRTGE